MTEVQKIEIDENGKQILMIYWPVGTDMDTRHRANEQIINFLDSNRTVMVLGTTDDTRVELIKINKENDKE